MKNPISKLFSMLPAILLIASVFVIIRVLAVYITLFQTAIEGLK